MLCLIFKFSIFLTIFKSYFWFFTGNSTQRRMFYYKTQLQLPVVFVENYFPCPRHDTSPYLNKAWAAEPENKHFKNLQIFQTDIQAEPWNPLKWSNKTKKANWLPEFHLWWHNIVSILNLFSLDLQETQIRNTTQRTWNLTNSVAIQHFLYPYEVFPDKVVILFYGTGTFFIFSLSEAVRALWHKSGIVCIVCFWYFAILWCILWLDELHSKLFF